MKNEIIGCKGFGEYSDIPDEEVKHCKEWIRSFITPLKAINRRRSSYNLKHLVEDACGSYIPNRAFIKAAIEMGYKYEIVREGSKNSYFNMSFTRVKECLRA